MKQQRPRLDCSAWSIFIQRCSSTRSSKTNTATFSRFVSEGHLTKASESGCPRGSSNDTWHRWPSPSFHSVLLVSSMKLLHLPHLTTAAALRDEQLRFSSCDRAARSLGLSSRACREKVSMNAITNVANCSDHHTCDNHDTLEKCVPANSVCVQSKKLLTISKKFTPRQLDPRFFGGQHLHFLHM